MTKRPRRRGPAPEKGPPAPRPDIDYGHGAVEGEPGGAQPGPARPPVDPPATPAPAPADPPTPAPGQR